MTFSHIANCYMTLLVQLPCLNHIITHLQSLSVTSVFFNMYFLFICVFLSLSLSLRLTIYLYPSHCGSLSVSLSLSLSVGLFLCPSARHHTNPMCPEWRWKMDPAEEILQVALGHPQSRIRHFRGPSLTSIYCHPVVSRHFLQRD